MELVELGELCTLIEERVEPKNLTCEQVVLYSIPSWDDGFPEVVSPDEIASSKFLVRQGDILVSRLNPSKHKTWRVSEDIESEIVILASTEWGVVRPNQDVDADYLHCALESPGFIFQMNAYVTGTTGSHQRVRMSEFSRLRVPTINEEKTKQIGDLYRLTSRYESTINHCVSSYEEFVHSIFKSWFIDFVPVYSKINQKPVLGLDSQIEELFPDSFENSELGPIPLGWKICNLEEIYDVERGMSYTGKGLCEKGFGNPMLNLASFIEGGGYKSKGLKYYSEEFDDKYIIQNEDVLFSTIEQTHDLSLVASPLIPPTELIGECCFSQDLLRARPKNGNLPGRGYLYLWSKFNRMEMAVWASGTTITRIPPDALKRFRLLLPNLELLGEFEQVFQKFQEFAEFAERAKRGNSELKGSLFKIVG